MEDKAEVYIKINENNEIIEINSNLFIESTEGYIKIDEGYGDKFAHAQGNYLDEPLMNLETMKYNYKYEDEKIVKNY